MYRKKELRRLSFARNLVIRPSIVRLISRMVALCGALTILSQPARAQNDWPYRLRSPGDSARTVVAEFAAEVIGLPSLKERKLPPRYREFRFEIQCGMCLPVYLIRVRMDPRGKLSGDAYELWFAPDTSFQADTSERIRIINTAPNNCATPLNKSARRGLDYTWCHAQVVNDLKWEVLLRRLDSLGILRLPSATGYLSDPPDTGSDTTKIGGRTLYSSRGECNDIADRRLEIALLAAAEFRSASLGCLELKPLGNTEYSRAGKAYRILRAAIVPYVDPREKTVGPRPSLLR